VIRAVLFVAAFSALAVQLPFDAPFFSEIQPGEREIRSLAAAWPDRIQEIGPRDGDWMLSIDGSRFAWAHGRMLPESERGRWKEYAALAFYDYPRALPPLPVLDDPSAARLRALVTEEQRHPPRRSEKFLGALLKAPNRGSTESRLVRTEISGFTVTVHERLRGPVSRVSRELDFLRKSDPLVSSYMRKLAEMNGYNFRFVEGTRSRSLHSYGTAIDLIPKREGGYSYWQWAMGKVPDWWTIPYKDRWMPPAALVRAFERQGFVWGGKWLFFDTMHFEYRPEILLMRASPGPRAKEEF
jgi:ribosomal protein L19